MKIFNIKRNSCYGFILLSLLTFSCSSNNLAKLEDKSTLSSGVDLITTYSLICNEYKSTEQDLFSCGAGFSSDLDLSKSKAILNAKVNIADRLSSTILKNEKEIVVETTKNGLDKKFESNSSNQVFEQSLNKYILVYEKSFWENGKYRSFVILKYSISS
jgi:hypothetical protein